jgi:hypothetical protein
LTTQIKRDSFNLNNQQKVFEMQTYTHLLIGGAISASLFPHQPLIQAAFIAGSIAPDLVMVPTYVLDKLAGRQPMTDQGKMTIVLKEISHSLFISIALIFLLKKGSPLNAFGWAMWLHIVIDGLTHCDYGAADQTCMWPFHHRFSKLGSVIGIWDYRYGPGILKPKPFELGVDVTCLALWLVILFK